MFDSFMKTDMMDSVYLINYRSMICVKSSIKEMQEITGNYYSYLRNFYMINGQNVENVASTNQIIVRIIYLPKKTTKKKRILKGYMYV